MPGNARREKETRAYRPPVQQDGAGSTSAHTAGFTHAPELEAVAQDFQKGIGVFDLNLFLVAIEAKGNLSCHRCYSFGVARWFLPAKARRTFSGVIGNSRMRMPAASWMALAIADETVSVPVSPTPLAPKGPISCGTSTMIGRNDSGKSLIEATW